MSTARRVWQDVSKQVVFYATTLIMIAGLVYAEYTLPSDTILGVRVALILVSLVFWIVGSSTYLYSPQHSSASCLLLNVVASMTVVFYLLYNVNLPTALYLVIICGSLLPALFVHSLTLISSPNRLFQNSMRIVSLLSGLTVVMAIVQWINGIVIELPGFLVLIAVGVVASVLLVLLGYLWNREPDRSRKRQLFVVLIGSLLQWSILMALALFGLGIHNAPLWLLSTLILPITVFVAIFRGRFMDVELRRGFVYSLISIALTIVYIEIFQVIARIGVEWSKISIVIGETAFVTLSFIPAIFIARRLTDFLVYRDHYDFRGLLRKLSEDITSYRDAEELGTVLVVRLTESLNLDGGAVISHLTTPPTVIATIGSLERTDLSDYQYRPQAVTHVFPMTIRDKAVGAILLSCKEFKKQLRAVDRDLLWTIAYQTAVALVNFQLVADLNARIRRLEIYEEERRTLHLRLMYSEEQERGRLSRDLHDGALQSLFHLIRQCEVNDVEEKSVLEKRLSSIGDLGRDIAYELREICRDLRPNIIDQMGLANALEVLVDRMAHNSSNMQCTFSVTGDLTSERDQVNRDSEMVLYRIVQEALSNVERHAQAKRIAVKLQYGVEALHITVVDDGIGFAIDDQELLSLVDGGHFGIVGMRERVEGLGGKLQISRVLPRGTEVKVAVPMARMRVETIDQKEMVQ